MPASAEATPVVLLGIDTNGAAELAAGGDSLSLASYWVGKWMTTSGWGGLENMLKASKASGRTPVLYWYYWGDSISPSCVENGCNGRSKAEWDALTTTLTVKIRDIMGGAPVYVVLENEFNKAGISEASYAPTFDGYLKAKADALHGVPGVKVVLGYGSWGESNWGRFPQALAASDAVGFQIMRASTKDTETSYRGAENKIASVLQTIHQLAPGKAAFLYDLALSSYPDAAWVTIQQETMAGIMARKGEFAQAGLMGIVYRTVRDNPNMSPDNYYGYAEKHWGLKTSTGTAKPALAAFLSGNGVAAPPAPEAPPPRVNQAPIANFTMSGADLTWTFDARASSDPDGDVIEYVWDFGASDPVVTRAFPSGAQSVTLTVRDAQGLTSSTTGTFMARAPNSVPTAIIATSGADDVWTFDGSASSDPDGDALAYAWTFSDGSTASGARVTRTLAVGSQSVQLSVSDGRGGAHSASVTIDSVRPAFAATFSGVKGNDYWVQTSVSANKQVTSVCAIVDGGDCRPLDVKSYGWAKSFYVKPGARVQFRASAGSESVTSGAYEWPSATPVSTTAPPPAPSVKFTPYDGNTYWVQARVETTATVKAVCASVDGGTCRGLTYRSWGAWAASFYAPTGSKVVFTATLGDGTQVRSGAYTWPVK